MPQAIYDQRAPVRSGGLFFYLAFSAAQAAIARLAMVGELHRSSARVSRGGKLSSLPNRPGKLESLPPRHTS